MSGLVWMLLANGAAVLGARALLRRVAGADPAFNLLAGILLHLTIVAVTVLLAGLAGVLRRDVLGPCGLAVLAFLLARGRAGRGDVDLRLSLSRAAVGALAAVAAGLAAQVWLLSPSGIDPLSYHLPKIADWVRSGSIWPLPGADPRESLPSGFELVETWWLVFLRHDVLIELAGVEFHALGFAAVLLLASRLGLSGSARPWGGLLYLLTPGLHLQATSAMNDGAVAALAAAAFGLVAARSHPWILVTAVLLGAGLKPTFLMLLPALAWLAWRLRREPLQPCPAPRTGWGVAAAAALPGLFWYARNLAWYGNPLYPAGDARLGGVPGPGAFLREAAQRLKGLSGPAPADAVEPISQLLVLSAGWGLVCFAVGIPALVLAVREDAKWRQVAAAFLLGLLCMAVLILPQMHFHRFVLFVPALLSIAALRWADRHPRARAALAGGGILLFLTTLVPYSWGLDGLSRAWRQDWSERGRDERLLGVPPEEDVAALAGLNAKSYSLLAPDFRRRVHYLGEVRDAETLAMEMDRLGLRWLDERGDPSSPRTGEAVQELRRRGGLKRAAPGLLERVRPP